MFHQLCGDNALARVILGTTNWGGVGKKTGKGREKDLATNFWKTMIDSGSKILRFSQTKKSARAFLKTILSQLKFDKKGEIKNDIPLQIQNEIVEQGLNIPETAAGQEFKRQFEKKNFNESDLSRIPGSETAAGPDTLPRLETKKTDKDAAKNIREQDDELHIPLTRKLFLKFFVSC